MRWPWTDRDVRRQRRRGLERFREAQDAEVLGSPTPHRSVWEHAIQEIADGEKVTHWMWFVFPQGKGLGKSRTSRIFALSRREARRYAADPVLGGRLRMATRYAQFHLRRGVLLEELFGPVDARKFRSCMDLFYAVTGEELFNRKEQH